VSKAHPAPCNLTLTPEPRPLKIFRMVSLRLVCCCGLNGFVLRWQRWRYCVNLYGVGWRLRVKIRSTRSRRRERDGALYTYGAAVCARGAAVYARGAAGHTLGAAAYTRLAAVRTKWGCHILAQGCYRPTLGCHREKRERQRPTDRQTNKHAERLAHTLSLLMCGSLRSQVPSKPCV
jgi:hypothetical protein